MYVSSVIVKNVLGRRMHTNSIRSLTDRYNQGVINLKNKLGSITLPERFKGTVVEKWVKYWKDIYVDYREVYKDVVTEAKTKPSKACFYILSSGFFMYGCKTNPDEQNFRDTLLSATNEVLLVSKQVRNPTSDNHLIFVESCYNAGLVRRFSFGFFSVIWLADYDECVGLFKANCSYLEPQYLTMHQRILDIGFLNKWWLLSRKMEDYDVNPEEWSSQSST